MWSLGVLLLELILGTRDRRPPDGLDMDRCGTVDGCEMMRPFYCVQELLRAPQSVWTNFCPPFGDPKHSKTDEVVNQSH